MPQPGGGNDIFINHLLESSLDFDQEAFDRVLHNIILHMGFERAITGVVYPFLQKIGLLWLTGHVVPAQEHFASTLITKKLMVAINALDTPLTYHPGKPTILLYTPTGEFHEIPLLYMRYLMKKNAVPTVYFGANVGLEDLQYYCSQRQVSCLYFHLVTHLMRCEPDQYLERLTTAFPEQQIVISGNLGQTLKRVYPKVRILRTLADMQDFARGN
jgi:hypothetical protein